MAKSTWHGYAGADAGGPRWRHGADAGYQSSVTPILRKIIPGKEGAGEKVETSRKPRPSADAVFAWVGRGSRRRRASRLRQYGLCRLSVMSPTRHRASPQFISGAGFIPFSGTGEAGATKAQTAAITRTANSALQQAGSRHDAGGAGRRPQSANLEGASLRNRAQQEVLGNETQLRARIGRDRQRDRRRSRKPKPCRCAPQRPRSSMATTPASSKTKRRNFSTTSIVRPTQTATSLMAC